MSIISFRSLAKSNAGFFKSDKQANYLLSLCDVNGVYKVACNASFGFGEDGNVNKQYYAIVQCDDKGVVSIVHEGVTTGKTKEVFKRGQVKQQCAAMLAQEAMMQAKREVRMQRLAKYSRWLECITGTTLKHRVLRYSIKSRIDALNY